MSKYKGWSDRKVLDAREKEIKELEAKLEEVLVDSKFHLDGLLNCQAKLAIAVETLTSIENATDSHSACVARDINELCNETLEKLK